MDDICKTHKRSNNSKHQRSNSINKKLMSVSSFSNLAGKNIKCPTYILGDPKRNS